MSYDFAMLATEFGRPSAPQVYRAMCAQVQSSPLPAEVIDAVDEVNTHFGVDVEDRDIGFLTVAASADARGAVLCTSWQSVPRSTHILLELSHRHGLLLYDPQRDRLYDPRGGVVIDVSLGGQVSVPYLTENLIAEYFDCPEPDGPFIIISRDDDHYAQAYVHDDGSVDIEYRDGGPDQHYATRTTEWGVAHAVLWGWATGSSGWRTLARWERIEM